MLSPITANRWDFNAAAHLLVRAGFGGDPSEIDKIQAMGPEKAKKSFVHYPANAYPNQPTALADDTHFNTYGAYELAKCVVKSIVDQNLPLKKFISKKFLITFKLNISILLYGTRTDAGI